MPHRRSRSSKKRRTDLFAQKRQAARIVSQHAIRDLQVKESINLLSQGEIAYHIINQLGTYDLEVVTCFERGEVLRDMHRTGSLQRIEAIQLE